MLSVRRLNHDNSWKIKWYDKEFLIDPWLLGSEIDGFRAFNEQWHATPSVELKDIGQIDLILITQGFHDHCHPETLSQLESTIPIAGVPAAFKKLKSKFNSQILAPIPIIEKGTLCWNGYDIARIKTNRQLAPFNALVLIKDREYILLAPHGCKFSKTSMAILDQMKCKLLLTTFTLYQLPFLLGGKINPGFNEAIHMINKIQPEFILNTHDENKIAQGIANKLAKITYPKELKLSEIPGFILTNHYQKIDLNK